jgi:hypothetical protein
VSAIPEEAGLADQPAEAWARWSGTDLLQRPGMAFFGRVDLARRFAAAVPRCGVITGDMPDDERASVMDDFRSRRLMTLASVACLTEGVDVPHAEVCMLARGVSHEGAYLQAVGRVLRPAPGKTSALLIDLPGASFRFGMPTDDRHYSLTGKAVSRAEKLPSLSQCLKCGACYVHSPRCPMCGAWTPTKPPRVRIWGVPLEDIGTELTPEQRAKLTWRKSMEQDDDKRREWFQRRLSATSNRRQVAAVFKGIFGRWPDKREGWKWQ